MALMKFEWGEILANSDNESEGAGDSFSSPSPPAKRPITGYLMITLNHPPTRLFEQAPSHVQKQIYSKQWHQIKNTFGIPDECQYVFEYCKSGRVHLHGLISLHCDRYFVMGAVSDMAKAYLNLLPRRYEEFKSRCCYPDFSRYRSPQITVQHAEATSAYVDEWRIYMQKQQV